MKGVNHILILLVLCLLAMDTDRIYAGNPVLPLPVNIQKCYIEETRSYDGRPGPKYWQNSADYEIKVILDPEDKIISGREDIYYENNSPDTLKKVVIRLYQNIFKKGTTRNYEIQPQDVHNGVVIEYLEVDNKVIDLGSDTTSLRYFGTNLIINLSQPLPPREAIDITIAWYFSLPTKTRGIRMGAYSDSLFFVAYWYPKIAVYDDIDGWDLTSYLGTQEFYNDFGDFDVEIEVPNGYLVRATGILQNPAETLSDSIYSNYRAAYDSETIIGIIKSDDYLKGNITVDDNAVIWNYRAENVPDFAFAVSNYYLWDGTSVCVDSIEKKRVFVDAVYSPESADFFDVADIAKKIIRSLSMNFPGVVYPYPEMTVFNRPEGGGMEFPMMVSDGSNTLRGRTIRLTSHEITHTYFPFYMGINENKYAWMDEGWAVMLPFDLQKQLDPSYDPIANYVNRYQSRAGRETEVPVMIPSFFLHGSSYNMASYTRPAIAYQNLREVLGDEIFLLAFREYIHRWNGKHPIPYDFFFTFNDVTGEDLSWFWKPWFFEWGYPDLAIKEVNLYDTKVVVIIEKIGKIPIPVFLSITFEDEHEKTIYKSARVWREGNITLSLAVDIERKIKKIEIGNDTIPDCNKANNIYIP
jgi:hypothetical protein